MFFFNVFQNHSVAQISAQWILTMCLTHGSKTLLKNAHWPPWGGPLANTQKES